MCLPYDMGNAGDLLKHGVLAEFVQWLCEMHASFRFIDLFGGVPWEAPVGEVARRVRALPDCALRAAQTGLGINRYYGSGMVARHAAEGRGLRSVRVLTGDRVPAHRARLRAAGLSMIEEDFPGWGLDAGHYDAYAALAEIAGCTDYNDLVLIDPFAEFLHRHARSVVPRLPELASRSAVLLFALNRDPRNRVGRRFDALLEEHLPGAWRLTCPPLPEQGVKGESKYHAEVVLAAPLLLAHRHSLETTNVLTLRERVTEFAGHLSGVLEVPAWQLAPRVVGSRQGLGFPSA